VDLQLHAFLISVLDGKVAYLSKTYYHTEFQDPILCDGNVGQGSLRVSVMLLLPTVGSYIYDNVGVVSNGISFTPDLLKTVNWFRSWKEGHTDSVAI